MAGNGALNLGQSPSQGCTQGPVLVTFPDGTMMSLGAGKTQEVTTSLPQDIQEMPPPPQDLLQYVQPQPPKHVQRKMQRREKMLLELFRRKVVQALSQPEGQGKENGGREESVQPQNAQDGDEQRSKKISKQEKKEAKERRRQEQEAREKQEAEARRKEKEMQEKMDQEEAARKQQEEDEEAARKQQEEQVEKEKQRKRQKKQENKLKTQEQQRKCEEKKAQAMQAKLDEEQRNQALELRKQEQRKEEARLEAEKKKQDAWSKPSEHDIAITRMNCLHRWVRALKDLPDVKVEELLKAMVCQAQESLKKQPDEQKLAVEDVANQIYIDKKFGWWLLACRQGDMPEVDGITEQRERLVRIIKKTFDIKFKRSQGEQPAFLSVCDAAHAAAMASLQGSGGA